MSEVHHARERKRKEGRKEGEKEGERDSMKKTSPRRKEEMLGINSIRDGGSEKRAWAHYQQ